MFIFLASNKVKNQKSVLKAKSAMDCLRILQDEHLFTQKDVIFMQFLCRETNCLKLYAKCIEYAEKQKALCFFEKPSGKVLVDLVENFFHLFHKPHRNERNNYVAIICLIVEFERKWICLLFRKEVDNAFQYIYTCNRLSWYQRYDLNLT